MTTNIVNLEVSEDLVSLPKDVLEKIKVLNQSLNPEQKRAAEKIYGPVIVTAGAGAGKTKTLINRAATMILAGIHPAYILISTFTSKAAAEIKDRLESEIGENGQYVNAGTFHSIIFREIIKKYPDSEFLKKLNFDVEELQILDDKESESLFKDSIKNLDEQDSEIIADADWKLSKFLGEISKHRALGRNHNDYLKYIQQGSKEEVFQRLTAKIWMDYSNRCRSVNGIDFDDILVVANRLLKAEPLVGKELSERYKYIMLDEYQDTNPVQMMIMDSIAKHHKNIFVVGDEKQSIYAFRGSDISIILNFKDRYPDAVQVDMMRNYRSYSEILRHGNALADAIVDKLNDGQLACELTVTEPQNVQLSRKLNQFNMVQFATDTDEADMVSRAIYRDIKTGVKGSDIFVLYRNRNHKKELEKKMVEMNIPYKIVNDTSFFQRQEVKDAIGLIRFIFQPWDSMAGLRTLKATSMNVSDDAAKVAMQNDRVNVYEFLRMKSQERLRAKKKGQDKPDLTAAAKKVAPFMELTQLINESANYQDDPQFLRECIAELWDIYFKEKIAKKEKIGTPQENINGMNEKIENVHYVLDRFTEALSKGHSLEEVIEDFSMRVETTPDNDTKADQKVQFMTLHASKGLEADVVYIVSFDNLSLPGVGPDGDQPSFEDYEESKRLAYVGITRAKKKCALSYGVDRMHNGKRTVVTASPFMEDISKRTNTKLYKVKSQSPSKSFSY